MLFYLVYRWRQHKKSFWISALILKALVLMNPFTLPYITGLALFPAWAKVASAVAVAHANLAELEATKLKSLGGGVHAPPEPFLSSLSLRLPASDLLIHALFVCMNCGFIFQALNCRMLLVWCGGATCRMEYESRVCSEIFSLRSLRVCTGTQGCIELDIF